jgi:hypothetical protein
MFYLQSDLCREIVVVLFGTVIFGLPNEKGSSNIEPRTTPAQPIVLKWETFTDAANEAGMSRRYGGFISQQRT